VARSETLFYPFSSLDRIYECVNQPDCQLTNRAGIAYQSMNPMTAPVAATDTRLVAQYGYTRSASPATICGHRPCFLPYTNRTNPTPPGMSETNSHVGSRDTAVELGRRHRTSAIEIINGRPLHSPNEEFPPLWAMAQRPLL
jgi:hypothetical protein